MALMPMFDTWDAMITKLSNGLSTPADQLLSQGLIDVIQRRMGELKSILVQGGEIVGRQCLSLCAWLARTKEAQSVPPL
jgi:hypothetical protein